MKNIITFAMMGILLMNFGSSALESLGTFKLNECLNIKQTCSSCSYVNVSVSYPNSTIIVSNQSMTDVGSGTWEYKNFCETSQIGRYDVTGEGDLLGTATNFATYFDITPSGFSATLGFYILIFVLSLGIILLGFYLVDAPITLIGSFGLYFVGLYMLINGIDGMRDLTYTWALSLLTLGLAFYISTRSAYELIVN